MKLKILGEELLYDSPEKVIFGIVQTNGDEREIRITKCREVLFSSIHAFYKDNTSPLSLGIIAIGLRVTESKVKNLQKVITILSKRYKLNWNKPKVEFNEYDLSVSYTNRLAKLRKKADIGLLTIHDIPSSLAESTPILAGFLLLIRVCLKDILSEKTLNKVNNEIDFDNIIKEFINKNKIQEKKPVCINVFNGKRINIITNIGAGKNSIHINDSYELLFWPMYDLVMKGTTVTAKAIKNIVWNSTAKKSAVYGIRESTRRLCRIMSHKQGESEDILPTDAKKLLSYRKKLRKHLLKYNLVLFYAPKKYNKK